MLGSALPNIPLRAPDRRDGVHCRCAQSTTSGCIDGTVSAMVHEELSRMELGFPGPLRDALVAAVLSGRKVATSSLHVGYDVEGSPLPAPGRRSIVVDSSDRPVAIIEITS